MPSTRVASIASAAFVIFSISSVPFTSPRSNIAVVRTDACSLLSTSEASTALGQASQPGVPEFGTGCVWSRESPPRDTSRQLHVNFHSPNAYKIAKGGNVITKVEPVSGVGDDAFYQLYPKGATPFLWVKKGTQAISIRISTPTKNAPFTEAELEAKLLVLGKAAAAKM